MSKFPVWMQHPNVRPAFIDRQNPANSRGVFLGPMQVYSDDQVAQYEAQGYQVCASPDPRNYEVEYGSGNRDVAYEHRDYPMWVTPDVMVADEAEHKAWLARNTPAEVVETAAEVAPPAAAPTDEVAARRAKEAARMRDRRAKLKAARQAA
jgi:hypothetical protein